MSQQSLANLISIVRFRGDYRSTIRFPDANLTTEIQAAWAELYELIADTNEGYWVTTGTQSTTANVDFVALPSDAWRVHKVSRLDGSDYVPMDQLVIGEIDYFSTSTTGRPTAYRLTARGVDLYLTPDAVYTLRFVYTPIAPTLSAAREFYNGWEEFVVYGALIRLAKNSERDVSDWERELEKQRARIIRGVSGRKAQEPEYLVLRDGSGWDETWRDERWR